MPVQKLDPQSISSQKGPAKPGSALAEYLLRPKILIRFVLYLTFLTYLPTVLFDFAYDDSYLILLNPWMASWKGIGTAFTHSFWAFLDFPRAADYYRPLVMTFFALIRHTAGAAPAWFHLGAIAVHLVAVYLTYQLARELTNDGTMAALAAAIFGLHPTKLESVAWISGVSDSLCVVFVLACVLVYLRWKKSGAAGHVPWSSLVLLLLAVLSKELAVVVPVLVLLYEMLSNEGPLAKRFKSSLRVVVPYAVVVTLVLIVRNFAIRGSGATGYNHHFLYSFYAAPQEVIWYLAKQLWPLPISIQYPILIVNHPSFIHFVLPLIALLVASIALLYSIRKSAAGWFLVAFFVLTLSPVLAFGVVLQLHDRHMYAPSVSTSIGLAYLIVTLVRRITRSGFPLQSAVIFLVCLTMAGLTLHEVHYWSGDISLFKRAIEVAPDNRNAYDGLSAAYLAIHDYDNAEKVGKSCIQNALDPSGGWQIVAVVRRERKDYPGARDALQQALQSAKTPSFRLGPELELGRLAQEEGNFSDAAHWYLLAIAEQPGIASVHEMYGHVLVQAGNTAEGERELQTAQQLRQRKGF